MTSAPRLSVIVPTCERPAALALCLTRLAPGAQSLAGLDYEVIVSDDGGNTVEAWMRERFPWARWTRGPQRGPAANRNHGATLARGDWLIFTDDDCLPAAGWLGAFAAAMPEASVLEGRTRADTPKRHPLDDSPLNEHGGNLWSCNFAIRRTLFAQIGGFDERFPFPAMEDMELHARLRAAGIPVRFVPEALIIHPWRRIADWRTHRRRHFLSRRFFAELHPGTAVARSPARLAWQTGRTIAREHLPFLVRHPIEALDVLPPLWLAAGEEIWLALRGP